MRDFTVIFFNFFLFYLSFRSKIGQIHLVLVDQLSRRSTNDFSGRNDNNSLVVFPNKQLPFVEIDETDNQSVRLDSFRNPEIGDYVACRLLSATSQSFKAEPLFICRLQSFYKIDPENVFRANERLNRIENVNL